jgi:fructosamine-3-kinase
MTAFARSVASLTGVAEQRLERLAGGDLSEVLLVRRPHGKQLVAKGGAAIATEAAMLRLLAGKNIPVPAVDADYADVLLLEHVENDGVFSPAAWRDIAVWLHRLHQEEGESYGWASDYRLGTVELDNRQTNDWPVFWGEQRLLATASLLDRPWRERIRDFVPRLPDLLGEPPPPALLHGDLWTGNILVRDGRLAALIDPACYHGDPEVDLAMLCLFGSPPQDFWNTYGPLRQGWQTRRPIYQLFPALVHLRLFGDGYADMVDRLLKLSGA